MSNDVSTKKFYQFLASYQTDGQNWTSVADGEYGNADGTVIKSEFRTFLNNEWNGEQNGELTNDLINSFWKKVDTNTSASKIKGTKLRNLNALDGDEVANLDKKLEAYVKLNEFVAANVKIPNVLTSTGSKWKWDVVDDLTILVEEFVQAGGSGDVNQMLAEAYPTIANKYTATYCAVEYQNTLRTTVLANYPDYKDDATLSAILEAYVAKVDGNVSPEDLKNDVIDIVDAYLATAGLGDDSGYDLSELGYSQNNNSPLNDIQKAVVSQSIKNNLSSLKKESDYKDYAEIYDSAMQTFIDNKLATATYANFETLKSVGLAEFKATDEYKSIENRILVDKNFKNIDANSSFYKALVEAFGETLAETIMYDAKYLTNADGENVYYSILEDAQERITNGEFISDGKVDLAAVQKFVIDEISKKLNEFFPNGFGDASIKSLNTMYDKRAEAASKETDSSLSLQQHRQAAIDYCNAISKKGTMLANAVKDVFGNNYTDAINKMYPSEIVSRMAELKEKALKIGEISDMTDAEKEALFNGVKDSYSLSLAEPCQFNLPKSATCSGTVITSDRISYTATGCVSVDNSTGKVTVNTNNPGVYSATLTVLIDNQVVHSKTITINVSATVDGKTLVNNTKEWSGSAPEDVTVMKRANGNNAGDPIVSQDFIDLYNNDAIICLGAFRDNDKYNWSADGASVIKERILSLGAFVVDTLASANSAIDKGILTRAMNIVADKYAVTPSGAYYKHKDSGDTAANFYNYMKDNKNKVKDGLVQVKDNDGADSNVYGFYFKEFVDAIITEYNNLVK